MTVRDFARVARGDDVEYTVACNGNAYPFDPDNAFFLCAYGDFEIDRVNLSTMGKDSANVIWAEIELKTELVKRAAGGRETEAPNASTSTPGTYAPVNTAHPAC